MMVPHDRVGRTRRSRRRRRIKQAAQPEVDSFTSAEPPPSFAPPAPPEPAPVSLSKRQIKAKLRAIGVEFDGRASKSDLTALLAESQSDGDGC